MSTLGQRVPSLVIFVIVTLALSGGIARGQEDLDRNKSGARLFAANCKDCHRRPRGLAKNRFGWTLFYFLQQHYTSSRASARALSIYLQSVDAPSAKRVRATRRSGRMTMRASEPPLRPPAPIPSR